MTDDQLQELIGALSGSSEPWSTALIAVGSAVLGFVLALVSESLSRARRRKDDSEERHRAAVYRANETMLRLMVATAAEQQDEKRDVQRATPGITLALDDFDDTGAVGAWWLRQMTRMLRLDAASADSRPGAINDRTELGLRTVARLRLWLDGHSKAEDFRPEFDDVWDEMLTTAWSAEERREG